jgi:hypothetical protein
LVLPDLVFNTNDQKVVEEIVLVAFFVT